MATTRDLAEIACSEAIAEVLNLIAAKTRVSAFNLATRVPGACHNHPPTKNVVPECAYCARNGNVFANDDGGRVASNDIVATYVAEITNALEKLQRDVRASLNGEHVAVSNDDLEADDLTVDELAADEFDDLDEALFKAMTEDM